MQIVFFCPPAIIMNGGTRMIFRMAERLRALGRDVVVFEEQARRPAWFTSTVPVVGQGAFRRDPEQLLVVPEDQPRIFEIFADWPNPKVVYAQNQFYAASGIGKVETFADYGVAAILCASQSIEAYARFRHPAVPAYLIPCGVDAALFRPLPKQEKIAFIPRKRRIESGYLIDMFRYSFPDLRSWAWEPLAEATESQVARVMGESSVFLSLARLDGFGLTGVEAMASGCVVAGFTGGGGREYATPENGFWAAEDDFEACVKGLEAAVRLAQKGPEAAEYQAYRKAAAQTAAAYTLDRFNEAVDRVWREITKE